MGFYIPPEIVREIIQSILDAHLPSATSEEPGFTTKPPWSLVRSLSLASRSYRLIVMELWFRTLFLKSPLDLFHIDAVLPQIHGWTRRLQCVQADVSEISFWDISKFQRLNTIRLDWLSRTLIPYWNTPEHPPERIPFAIPSCRVFEFDIRGLSWPSPHAFKLVSFVLQDLKIFRMRQRRIWCGLCHTCCEPMFLPPGPGKIVYTDGFGLPIHYAQALSKLTSLEEVYITVSDAGKGKTILTENCNPHMWAGECDRCMEVLYDDNSFRENWIARKKGIRIGENADVSFYVAPPALRRVEWHFLRSTPVEVELPEVESDGEDSVLETGIEDYEVTTEDFTGAESDSEEGD